MVDIVRPEYGQGWASQGERVVPTEDKMELGWVQEMMPFQWENYLQGRQDDALLYLLQKGIPEYSDTQEYIAQKSAVLYMGAVYIATQTVTGVLPTVTASWKRLSTISDASGVVSIAGGGTGASTASGARTNLGLGTASVLDADVVVQKDASGNFSAGTITASIAGNATTSSSWLTGRTISLSGAVTGTSSAWKGDGNLTITTTSLDATKLTGEVPSVSLPLVVKKSSDTGIAYIPMGTTPERPTTPTSPGTRINSTTGMMEFWNGSAWISVTGGAESYFSSQLQNKVDRTSLTGAAILPEGTDAERPTPGALGFYVRLNKTSGKPEWYNRAKSSWQPFGDAGGELFDYSWHNGPRSSLDAGRVPTDGQQLLLLTHPDVCQAVWDGKQHSVDESVWQADPTKRNCWSRGDGTSWVRVPDLNAAVAGTGKPFYMRGGPDGLNGTSVGDAIRDIKGTISNYGPLRVGAKGSGALQVSTAAPFNLAIPEGTTYTYVHDLSFKASNTVPTADENRVKTAYGVWTVRVFTEVSNAGALDAGQLATQLGVVDAAQQALQSQYNNEVGFTIIYPNGGTEAAPANVSINSRYVMDNPFPGFHVITEAEILVSGVWGATGFIYPPSGGMGVTAYPYTNAATDKIVVTTGSAALCSSGHNTGSPHLLGANLTTPTPCRVKVWKLKGGM